MQRPDQLERMSRSQGTVEWAYHQLKTMAANYAFKPDSRLNEGELARHLETSRTPLREALNRLVAEGFLTFRSGQGFFCRSLTPQEIMDLYEARAAIECEAVKLASQRATVEAVLELEAFLDDSHSKYHSENSPVELVKLDEEFHLRLAALSGNAELVRLLENVNGRLHFVRLVDLKSLSRRNGHEVVTTEPHRGILAAVKRQDPEAAQAAMRAHIERRRESITEIVRNAFAELYAP